MKRNDLMPTVVTDKNGKVTTVHRKPSAGSKSARKLPAPVSDTEVLKAMSKRVSEALEQSHGRQDPVKIQRFIRKMGDFGEAFVEAVEKAAQQSADGVTRGKSNLSYLIITMGDESAVELKNLLQYKDLLPEDAVYTDARFVIKAIGQRYDGDKFSADYREKLRTHLYASSIYQRQDADDYTLFDYEDNLHLVDLIMRRPEDVEEIMRLHNEYKVPLITDETIEEYRNHHSALGHGIL